MFHINQITSIILCIAMIFQSSIPCYTKSLQSDIGVGLPDVILQRIDTTIQEYWKEKDKKSQEELFDRCVVAQPRNVVDVVEELGTLDYNVEFKPVNTKKAVPDLYSINSEIQHKIYLTAKKYKVNYFLMLSIALLEGSKNNPFTIHMNTDGSIDIGIFQINSKNLYLLEKLGYPPDINLLYNPDINIACAALKLREDERYYKECDNLFGQMFCYTGGIGTLTDFMYEGYDDSDPRQTRAYNYSIKGVSNIINLYKLYSEI